MTVCTLKGAECWDARKAVERRAAMSDSNLVTIDAPLGLDEMLYPEDSNVREHFWHRPTPEERMARCRQWSLHSLSHMEGGEERLEIMPYLCGLRRCDCCRTQMVHRQTSRMKQVVNALPGNAAVITCSVNGAADLKRSLQRRFPKALFLFTLFVGPTAHILMLASVSDLSVVSRWLLQNKSDTPFRLLHNPRHVLQWVKETLEKALLLAKPGQHAFSWTRGILTVLCIDQPVAAAKCLWRRTWLGWQSVRDYLHERANQRWQLQVVTPYWRYILKAPPLSPAVAAVT